MEEKKLSCKGIACLKARSIETPKRDVGVLILNLKGKCQ
jgi:hypothetical protein